MKIIFNSKEMELAEATTVGRLKQQAGLSGRAAAIAVNGKIVPAPQHDIFTLSEGDEVIAIGAAYGG